MARLDTRATGTVAEIEPTRRDALKLGGGFALAAALVAGFGGQTIAAAQADAVASPVTSDTLSGKYVMVRLRKLKAGVSVTEEILAISDSVHGYVPLIRALPGFVAYFGIDNPDTGEQVFVGIYADKEEAAESNRLAGEWLQSNGYEWFEGDPTVAEGVIRIAATAG